DAGYYLQLPFGELSVSEIVSWFDQWARQEAKRKKTTTVKRGVASMPPYHRLKQLSALRLSKSLTYEKAMDFISQQIPELDLEGNSPELRVIPYYGEPTHWYRALKEARAEVVSAV